MTPGTAGANISPEDAAMIDRRIESLRVEFQPVAEKFLHMTREDLGIDVRVHETLRTPARQTELSATGASDVTMGWHNVGLAFDFGCYLNGVYQADDRAGLYAKCGLIAQALGCKWPIVIKSGADLGHVEYHPGFTLQQFLAGQKGGIVA